MERERAFGASGSGSGSGGATANPSRNASRRTSPSVEEPAKKRGRPRKSEVQQESVVEEVEEDKEKAAAGQRKLDNIVTCECQWTAITGVTGSCIALHACPDRARQISRPPPHHPSFPPKSTATSRVSPPGIQTPRPSYTTAASRCGM